MMISKFAVTNYRNFKDRIELNLSDSNKYKFNQGCIKNGHISKMILMGNNGSGKTNLGYALFDIVMTLTNNHTNSYQKDERSLLNCNSSCKESFFEYTFKLGKDVVEYCYKKKTPTKITYERYAVNNRVLLEFDYVKQKYYLDRINFKGTADINIDCKSLGYISFIRIIYASVKQEKDSVLSRLFEFVKGMLYVSNSNINAFIGDSPEFSDIQDCIVKNNLIDGLNKFLRQTASIDMTLKEVYAPHGETKIAQVFENRNVEILKVASAGTRNLVIFYYWFSRAKKPTFVFYDDFDSNYHFELSENIVRFVIDNYECQVMMTTQNTGLINTSIMRPDCYFLIDKNRVEAMCNLTDRELRECHNLEKLLRAGEFDIDQS